MPPPEAEAAAIGVRDAAAGDDAAVARIYAHHVLHGTASFELAPPDADEIARRRAEVTGRNLPYLVATAADGEILGFAYASPYRPRPAYRFTVEDSVYVAPGHGGRGIGRLLLAAVIERCTALGFRQMVAAIGDGANAGSIALHRSLGFRQVGVLTTVGYKHGAWRDVVFMQRPLGDGAATPPEPPPTS